MLGLTSKELALLKRLSTPVKIQNFLDTLPINHEKNGPTQMSPRRVLREGKAHCIEGAMLAATALWLHGEEPFLLDLRSLRYDDDHVVTLFKKNGFWGALSKTNHAVLGYRDPVYKTVRELALSYFHEYFMLSNGRKTLREYSLPFNLKRCGSVWVTSEEDLWNIAEALNDSRHLSLVPRKNERFLRPATPFERKVTSLAEWKKNNRRA
ncbi:MAG: hypothetical protein ABI747_00105 [Candidatus Moraniibacteriota bacterium]